MTETARCGCLHYLPVNVEEPDSPCKNCGHRETAHMVKAAERFSEANLRYYHAFLFVPCRALVGASLNVGQSS